jgi:hypothetical protein
MPLYLCEVCGISTKLKNNYIRHLNTLKHLNKCSNNDLNKTKKNKKSSKTLKIEEFEPQITHFSSFSGKMPKKNKFSCSICEKSFSRKDNLKRHNEKKCNSNIVNKNIDYKELFYNMKTQYENDKTEFKKQIEILINKVGNTTTINNTQNIQLNSYGKEDISHINEVLKTELLKIPYAMIPKLIEAVHFNDTKPENKNIYLPNKKDNLIKIYKNNKWIYKDKDETLNDLVDSKYTMLDNHYDNLENTDLTPFIKMNYLKFRKYYDEGDKELSEQIKKECDLILLNNR